MDDLKAKNTELKHQVDPSTLPAQEEIKQLNAKVFECMFLYASFVPLATRTNLLYN